MKKNNLDYKPELVKEVVDDNFTGQTSELLNIQPIPTAIIVYDDLRVPLLFNLMRERGLSVIQDIAVAGFYDFRIAEQWYPRLTTVRVPLHEMGAQATRKLIRLINKEGVDECETKIKTELIIRESCGSKKHGYNIPDDVSCGRGNLQDIAPNLSKRKEGD